MQNVDTALQPRQKMCITAVLLFDITQKTEKAFVTENKKRLATSCRLHDLITKKYWPLKTQTPYISVPMGPVPKCKSFGAFPLQKCCCPAGKISSGDNFAGPSTCLSAAKEQVI